MTNGWISVRDELPPVGQSVILADSRGTVAEGMLANSSEFFIYYPISGGLPAEYPITHWQPLPEPPAEANDDN